MILENTKLSLSNIIQNYNYITGNKLDLSSFISDYKQDKKAFFEEKEEIVLHTNFELEKTLHLDKKTGQPIKMEIIDTNKNNKVYILYNEVKLN